MNLSIFYIILFLKVISARYTFIPRFFAQDSAIIVDTDKTPLTTQHLQKSLQIPYYPSYHTIPRVPAAINRKLITKELSKNREATQLRTTTESHVVATSVILTKDEFPKDLLDIAQNKLGINSLDEIPSISELGELLGTESAQETIKYIRDITATEEGIALVKAYIESSDYTDSTSITNIPSTTDYSTSTNEITYHDKNLVNPNLTPSFFERLATYFNIFDFFVSNKESDFDKNLEQLNSNTAQKSMQKPLLVRHPLPYHYPIPLRPVVAYKPRNTMLNNAFRSAGHLNTPKLLQQPLKNNPKETSKFESTLQQKQHQLALLAENVSKFPLTHDLSVLIDAQYVSSIEKAIAQDKDLKKLMSSADTLK